MSDARRYYRQAGCSGHGKPVWETNPSSGTCEYVEQNTCITLLLLDTIDTHTKLTTKCRKEWIISSFVQSQIGHVHVTIFKYNVLESYLTGPVFS